MINFLKAALWSSTVMTMLSILFLFVFGSIWMIDQTDTTMKALIHFFFGTTFVSMSGVFFSVLGFILMGEDL